MLVVLLALATVIDAGRNEARAPEDNFVNVEARSCLEKDNPCWEGWVRHAQKTVLLPIQWAGQHRKDKPKTEYTSTSNKVDLANWLQQVQSEF